MSLIPYDEGRARYQFQPAENLPTSSRGPILYGFLILLVAFGGFGGWASIAPLNSATITSGEVTVEGDRKTVQHDRGGTITEILVTEGAEVRAGDVLIRLAGIQAKAAYGGGYSQYLALSAREARLKAERDDRPEVIYPDHVLEASGEDAGLEIIAAQDQVFSERGISLQSQVDIFNKRVNQLEQRIQGLRAQIGGNNEQIKLLDEELAGLETLFQKGYVPKTRILALKRARANLAGQIGRARAQISEHRQGIEESKLQAVGTRKQFKNTVVAELADVQARMGELSERLVGQKDVVDRLEVRAPTSGTVVGLEVNTVGGVVNAGAPIMDIVPSQRKLIIESRVDPKDIDIVQPGLEAQVQLTAFKRQKVPPLEGVLTHVSADRFTDQRTGQAYYRAFIEVDKAPLEEFADVDLYPGMQASVTIVTGKRTALQYFVQPFSDRFHKAFRED